MMKNCLLLLLSFSCQAGWAQSRNPDSLRAKTYELKVKTSPPEGLKLPFESIKVIDSRFDTSKLGFGINKWASSIGTKSFFRILLKPGIGSGIENFYNQYYLPGFSRNGKILLISIKKLWIDNLPARTPHNSSKQNVELSSSQNIYAKFEFYIGSQDLYVPLVRVDTVFQLTPLLKVNDYDRTEEDKLPFLCFALQEMIETVNFEWYLDNSRKKKEMSVADIESYNARIKNIPILTETMKQGVFLTWNEFKNNLPSVTSFSKRKLSKTNVTGLFDKNGNAILHYYACYDGTTLQIGKPLSSLSKKLLQGYDVMYRVGDSFQYYEDRILNDSWEPPVNSIKGHFTNLPIYLQNHFSVSIPRQLDLETGNFY
jgi:hypothetical protein